VSRDADCIVVGGGVTGVAALRELARAGLDALLVEQFTLGHDRGSSHGASRIFRLAYPEPDYARMARRALEGWRALEGELGEQLISRTGSLDIGQLAVDDAAALATLGVAHELLDGRDAAKRWPLSFVPGEPVLFQPDGGTLRAGRAILGLLDGARAAGARIVEQTPVKRLSQDGDGVVLDTADGSLTARAAVVAAGAWSRRLLAPLAIELETTPTRETVTYFELEGVEEIPTVIDYTLIPYDQSGTDLAPYSLAAPGVGLKASLHRAGPQTDPSLAGEIDETIVVRTADWVARRFPDANSTPLASETCIYTNTPDEGFVIERHGRIVVASACSGHGFKFAPALGETISELVSEALDYSSR
jgi:sarcosine oxidase